MNVTTVVGLLVIGFASGMLGSMVGIGGGVIIVPGLVFLMAMSQKMAQGTSLAMMLPPIGVFAVLNYYRAGFVDFKVAGILCVAFVAGTFLGSKVALGFDEVLLKRIFGGFLLVMAVKYLFFSK